MVEQTLRAGVQTKSGTSQFNFSQTATPEMQPSTYQFDTKAVHAVISGTTDTDSNGASTVRAITAITQPNGDNGAKVSTTGQAITFSAPTAASVGVASASAVAANTARRYLLLVNTSGSTISLGLSANAAVLYSGITLQPNGGAYEFSDANGNLYLGAVNAIASAAASNLAIQEGT